MSIDGSGSLALPSALEHRSQIARQLEGKRPVLFLDYDGTLTPIVPRPEDAKLSPEMRSVLRELATKHTVAIVSGRDRADVESLVQLDELFYAGSHGFDISGPGGLRMQREEGLACLPDLDAAEARLRQQLASVEGSQVERKRFAIAVHYRNVAEQDVGRVEPAVDEALAAHSRLRKRGGKKIFELQPNIEWHKGRAVLYLLEVLDLGRPDVLPIYLGDDLTDEDAFRALAERGNSLGVLVGEVPQTTRAGYHLRDTDEVKHFLNDLL